jgi:hypothetical protein
MVADYLWHHWCYSLVNCRHDEHGWSMLSMKKSNDRFNRVSVIQSDNNMTMIERSTFKRFIDIKSIQAKQQKNITRIDTIRYPLKFIITNKNSVRLLTNRCSYVSVMFVIKKESIVEHYFIVEYIDWRDVVDIIEQKSINNVHCGMQSIRRYCHRKGWTSFIENQWTLIYNVCVMFLVIFHCQC